MIYDILLTHYAQIQLVCFAALLAVWTYFIVKAVQSRLSVDDGLTPMTKAVGGALAVGCAAGLAYAVSWLWPVVAIVVVTMIAFYTLQSLVDLLYFGGE